MNYENTLPINFILKGNKHQYCIVDVLGQGSFGIIYLAKIIPATPCDKQESGVMVAIKEFFIKGLNERSGSNVTINCHFDGYNTYRKNFLREINNMSKLNHPNIVKLLESFEENNTLYFSMEYIDGESLDSYIQSGHGLSEKAALENLIQIAGALTYMHNLGILHLDLKPLNIMRRKNNDLVLIDFGESLQFKSAGSSSDIPNLRNGSCGYMPIEQYNINSIPAFSPTTDIYSLGATLYKMLTGNTPPAATNLFNDSYIKRELINNAVSQETVSLILWAMNPLKENRPQTTEQFIEEINRILPNAPDNGVRISSNVISGSEPTAPIIEICNGFNVHWNTSISEYKKGLVRNLLNAMHKIGEKKYSHVDEYLNEETTIMPVMSLGKDTWKYLYPIIVGENTTGYFPPHSINTALDAILELTLLTRLPFRLPDEDEIIDCYSTSTTDCKNIKVLCYSKNNKLQYRTFGIDGGLNDIEAFRDYRVRDFEIQLVCDGNKTLYYNHEFNIPYTQGYVNDIQPIGFSLYKVQEGEMWNIKSPYSPMLPYLEKNFEYISNINIHHTPGPGPMSGYDYFGIVAHLLENTYYYAFENGKFKLLEVLSKEEIKIRSTWT